MPAAFELALHMRARHVGASPLGAIAYSLLADLQNTVLAAFLVFSGRVLYPSYGAARALDEQIAAGILIWVPMSLV